MPGSGRGRESIRLIAVAVIAAGIAVGVVEATKGSGSSSHTSSSAASHSAQAAAGPGKSSVPAGRTLPGGGAAAGKGAAASVNARVAVSAAVKSSLRHDQITLVLDAPAGGPLSEQNDSIAKGAAVAVDEINGEGGLDHHVHVKLLTQTLDGLSPAALRARLDADAAAALILPCDTSSQSPLAAAGAQIGLLMLAPCNSDANASERDPTYWPIGMSTEDEADGLAAYLASDNYRRLFIIAAGGSGYEAITAAVRTAARSQGITVTGSASVSPSNPNLGPAVQALESVRPLPAAVFTALPPPLVNRLGAALRNAGLGTTIFGSTAMDTRLTLTAGARNVENATFASYGYPREDPAGSRFISEYRSDYGRPPVGSFPGLGFETIRLLSTAAARAHSANPSAIQRALARGLTLSGIALADRTYRPGSDHNPVGEVAAVSKVSYGSIIGLLASSPSP